MPMQSWSQAHGKEWGKGTALEKQYKDAVSELQKLEAKLASMDKPEIEKVLAAHKKAIASAKALEARVNEARVAWFKYIEAERKKEQDEARKKVEALYKQLLAANEPTYANGSRESTDCISAAAGIRFELDRFTSKIEKALMSARVKS